MATRTAQAPTGHICGTTGCGKPIAKDHYVGEYIYGARWEHADGTSCIKTFRGGSANVVVLPKPYCPDCGSHGITTTQEAWCDRTTCPCGYTRTYMIGD